MCADGRAGGWVWELTCGGNDKLSYPHVCLGGRVAVSLRAQMRGHLRQLLPVKSHIVRKDIVARDALKESGHLLPPHPDLVDEVLANDEPGRIVPAAGVASVPVDVALMPQIRDNVARTALISASYRATQCRSNAGSHRARYRWRTGATSNGGKMMSKLPYVGHHGRVTDVAELAGPEAPNWPQHWSTRTNQHPITTGTR